MAGWGRPPDAKGPAADSPGNFLRLPRRQGRSLLCRRQLAHAARVTTLIPTEETPVGGNCVCVTVEFPAHSKAQETRGLSTDVSAFAFATHFSLRR